MRFLLFVSTIFAALVLNSCVTQTPASQNAADNLPVKQSTDAKHVVLVELYTSEGCSSCPLADRALTLLEKQQPVNSADAITLEFHVDYWDGPGWRDPFSSAIFTQRQEEYASAFKLGSDYTPQMIVDGQTEFVGSDLVKANNVIGKSAASSKGNILAKINGGSIKIAITNLPPHETATVFLAAAEDDLASNVNGGENAGEMLRHTSVVRELKAAGLVEKDAVGFETEAALPSQSGWKKENLRFVLFVQENTSRKVIAVGRVAN